MGMSTYYLKARFASAKKAAAALPQFAALISEGVAAEEWWGTSTQQCDDAFWHDFKRRFGLVFDHLSPAIRSDPHAVSCFLNFSDNDQRDRNGWSAPLADLDWIDLGETYLKACQALGRKPKIVAEIDQVEHRAD